MKLKAVKEGRYGFELVARVYPSLKKEEGVFVYLESLYCYCGSRDPLVYFSMYKGDYCVEFLKSIKGYEERLEELGELFFGCRSTMLSLSLEGCVVSIPQEIGFCLYRTLCGMLNSARLDATAYAIACSDGRNYPIKITLDLEIDRFS